MICFFLHFFMKVSLFQCLLELITKLVLSCIFANLKIETVPD